MLARIAVTPITHDPGSRRSQPYLMDVVQCAAAVACTIVAVAMRQSTPLLEVLGLPLDAKYLLLCLAALLWGTSRAGGNVVDSSLADSVPTGALLRRAWARPVPRSCHWQVLPQPLM